MNDEDNWTNRVIRGILNDLRMIENENEYKTNNCIKELKVKRLIWICWMKSKTESRYWNEFYHYEQWLIDNGLLSSSNCYSLTGQMCDEYLIGLNGYIEMMKKRYKKNTVRSKVSRLIQCFRSAVNNSTYYLLRSTITLSKEWNW